MRGDKKKYPEGYANDSPKARKAIDDLLEKNKQVIQNTEEYLGIRKKTYIILKDGKLIQSETPGQYAGHKRYKIFGTLECRCGKRMKKGNRVFFHSLEDAVKEGYRPCQSCKPIDEEDFKKIKHLTIYQTLKEFYNRDKK